MATSHSKRPLERRNLPTAPDCDINTTTKGASAHLQVRPLAPGAREGHRVECTLSAAGVTAALVVPRLLGHNDEL
jgi:hypothetical protein